MDLHNIIATWHTLRSSNFRASGFVAIAIFIATTFSFTNSAYAEQTDADFSKYCRLKFPNSSYQRILQSWGLQHACVQGGTRQAIDFAEACGMMTGSRNYEISGMRVLCEGSVKGAQASKVKEVGAPDFNQYCRKHFPNSVYERRAESHGVVHYCRRPGATGGFTLQHIDLPQACRESHRTGNYKVAGSRVSCLEEDKTVKNIANRPAMPTPILPITMPPAANVPTPDKPINKPERILDARGNGRLFDRDITLKDLNGCGFHGLPGDNMKTAMRNPRGIDGWGWEYAADTKPCPGLVNGKRVSFQTLCDMFDDGGTARLTPNGKPVCWMDRHMIWPSWPPAEHSPPLRGNILSPICRAAYFGRVTEKSLKQPHMFSKEENEIIPIVKYSTGQLEMECFYIKYDHLKQLIVGGPVFEIGDLGGGGLSDSQWDDEEYLKSLEKRKKELGERQKELEKEMADRRKKFLDSEDGKKTKKKLDELEEERKKRLHKLERESAEYKKSLESNCCAYESFHKAWEWKMRRKDKIDEDIDKRTEDAIDEGMKKTDPKGQKKYQDARKEHKGLEDELRDTTKAIDEEAQRKFEEDADRGGSLPLE